MIELQRVSVSYGGIPALRDVNLQVPRGSCALLTGPSGCGKSTLARVICGIIPHALPAQVSGEVRVDGRDVLTSSLPELAQRAGMLFQNPATQLFHLRVADEVAFGPRNLGWGEAQVQESVNWALAATGLADLREERPAELSGGQKQRLAIAAALAMRPALLVLDEPCASLDVPSTRRLVATLRRLNAKEGVTILIIEHRLAEIADLADRALLMAGGQIVADGAPTAVLGDLNRTRSLGLRRLPERPIEVWDRLLAVETRRDQTGEPLLALCGITAGYGPTPVLHQVDLAVYPGDFIALVGDNGSGKSTLARVAAGLLKPIQGQVRYAGGRRPRPGRDVALLFQNPAEQLFTDSVEEEVAFGPRNYGCADPGDLKAIMEQMDLLSLRRRPPLALSTGQQQRTAIAACLAMHPQLLILDEPTLGQDWGHQEQLLGYLAEANRQGTAVLLITHDYKLVHRCARRVVLLEDGRIRDGKPRQTAEEITA